MIEVEKKVVLQATDLQKIEQMGVFISSSVTTDTYYDTKNYDYTKSDIWLRERNCFFELKIGIKDIQGITQSYKEIFEESEILHHLGLERGKNTNEALAMAHIYPYATYQTLRRTYQLENFTFHLDLAYFDDFIYRVAEIKLLVNSESKIGYANRAITQILERLEIDTKQQLRPKLIEFLAQKNPAHYQALVSAGVTLPDASQEIAVHPVLSGHS